jgi:hypothetical protein
MDHVRSLVAIGFSAGVQSVRKALVSDLFPPHDRLGIVCMDGTHASWPAARWQIDVWTKIAEEARRDEKLFVATCTANTYVEQLREPFSSTLTVLHQAVEPALFPSNPPQEFHTKDLHVYAYGSDSCDMQAHAKQQTEALPMVLEKHVLTWLEREHRLTPLEVAQGYVGWKEDGTNRGAIVRASLAGCIRDGQPLGIHEGVPWCAAFVGLCDFEAHAQHVWRASVRELVHDAVTARTWREIDDYIPQPGDLAVFKRDGSDPRFGSEGHIERVEERHGIMITSIGGNVNNAVTRRTWAIDHLDDDSDLVGWIVRTGLSQKERELVEANTNASLKRFAGATLGA